MRKVFVLTSTLLLAACAGGIRTTQPATVYDFGFPAQRIVADDTWSRLALDVKSPPWFDSLYIDYRLAYDDPLRQREYSGSRWAGAPEALLAQRLSQQLGIANGGASVAAQCVLRVELQMFSQIFDSPQRSRGVLQASVSVIDRKRQVVAGRRIDIEKAADAPDAHGGVMALAAASDELGRQLASWLAQREQIDVLQSCRQPR